MPACPNWTVQQLLAHQVHQLRGALDGSFPIAAALGRVSASDPGERAEMAQRQDSWIASGVAELGMLPVDQLAERWTELSEGAPDAVLDALLPDVVVHLFDLLGVSGNQAFRDNEMTSLALRYWASVVGEPVPENSTERFELLRAITGRRSRDQAPSLRHEIAVYGWRSEPLSE